MLSIREQPALARQVYPHLNETFETPPRPLNVGTVLQCPYTSSDCPIASPFSYDAGSMPIFNVQSNPTILQTAHPHLCPSVSKGMEGPANMYVAAANQLHPIVVPLLVPNLLDNPTTVSMSFKSVPPQQNSMASTSEPYQLDARHPKSDVDAYTTHPLSVTRPQESKKSPASDIEDVANANVDADDGHTCTAFISKLYHLCSHSEYQDYIRWNSAGDAFVLAHANHHFAQSILPRFFRHRNVPSFIRQLNLYNFRRLPTIQLLDMFDNSSLPNPTSTFSGFKHPHFRRGDETSLRLIKPKPSKTKKKAVEAVLATDAALYSQQAKRTHHRPV